MLNRLNLFRFLSAASLVVGYRAAGLAVGIFIQLFIARTLPASDLGLYFMVTSLAAIGGIFATLGYPLMVPKYIAGTASGDDQLETRRFLKLASNDMLVVSLFVSAIGTGVTLLLADPGASRSALLVGLACVPFAAMLRFNGAIANSMKRFSLGFFPDLALRPMVLTLVLIGFWAAGRTLAIEHILVLFLMIAAATAIGQHLRVSGLVRSEFSGTGDPDDLRGRVAAARKNAISMLTGMLFLAASADLAILFASWFLESADLAVFGVCLKLAMICGFAINAVQQVVVRDLGDALEAGEPAAIRQVLRVTNRTSTALAAGAILGTLFLGDIILSLFGEAYRNGFECLLLLMLVNLVRAVAGPSLQMISLVNAEAVTRPVFLSTLCALMVLMSVLIPTLGLNGAAIAFLIATAIWPFWLSYAVHRKTGIAPILTLN